ncbi:MAG: hypothetical protein SGJ23_17375 [Alphaproteobacteria bacterium]|nr:hypothetical protein [Alphaproteobacteria bacterium]
MIGKVTSPPAEGARHSLRDPGVVWRMVRISVAWVARSVVRLWVVGLLVAAAMGSGVALNQMFQARGQLESLRAEPGPDAYAVVAYRRELARQIETMGRNRTEEAVPQPPPRPQLLEEIDIARQRNQQVVSQGSAVASAPTMPVVNAPD